MLIKKVEEVLNRQIGREAYSSNLYLAMASWAENQGLQGSAKWFYAQAEEEHMHMLKFIEYINERGGHAIIPALEQPPVNFDNIRSVFDEVLKHEIYISESINEIVGICLEEKDFSTHNWIQWFVTEQIEEEASVRSLIDNLKLIGDGPLYHFDKDIMSMRGESPDA